MNTNKQRLLLISDLWGKEKSDWITYYTSILEHHFQIVYYDSCDLGTIDKSDYSEENLHHQFVNGGIDRAVSTLIQKEKQKISVVGFSIGGTIAWKAALLGLKIENLFAISSTRLRHETEKPLGKIKLFYGENDTFRPDNDWVNKMNLTQNLIPNQDHECYTNEEIAQKICKIIVAEMTN